MQKMTLRALRVNNNLSAKEAAKKIGIHHQTLLKYEHDSSRIPLDLLHKLANLYQIDPNFIFLGHKSDLKQI
ncbi:MULTISPECIES: helix-turn-helix domain-containing protein [Streptococcus]|uniref:Helix-turn-helix transcriptional regulator n=2 Tax=Streptococcus anginosus group TaxID=671232 RepID=A0AAW5TGM5_STRAP|nr:MULTISPECIES: helix-turn-helix transcriptional regulator [Streptococcus]HER0935494.1 helix-turn-helix transcriptional regulator [Streptococcus pyogenes]KAA9260931.1 helix-turn-helix transcriptional regulator [Streptococcus anginosus]KAA9321421.1 helix-turn-helix transcriptional regulator [Streptococcus anginosus]MCW0934471.1 helix-turn-helix transcriptional regulator [Streptococcus anginosus]MCW0948414.1 helix-turn-helix transcriptional regulator [Streptococcus anginosus]